MSEISTLVKSGAAEEVFSSEALTVVKIHKREAFEFFGGEGYGFLGYPELKGGNVLYGISKGGREFVYANNSGLFFSKSGAGADPKIIVEDDNLQEIFFGSEAKMRNALRRRGENIAFIREPSIDNFADAVRGSMALFRTLGTRLDDETLISVMPYQPKALKTSRGRELSEQMPARDVKALSRVVDLAAA